MQRIYAGRINPDNPSHFTIEFETNGRRQIVDGWLRDDDSVILQPGPPEN